jgi:hypothetical protein
MAEGTFMVGNLESRKDMLQELTESAADHVGKIAMIITGAVRDVAREVGDWATDAFEMREAAHKATADDAKLRPDEPVN